MTTMQFKVRFLTASICCGLRSMNFFVRRSFVVEFLNIQGNYSDNLELLKSNDLLSYDGTEWANWPPLLAVMEFLNLVFFL